MRHKQSLMKIHLKKMKGMDEDIILDDFLQVICADTTNDRLISAFCYNGQKHFMVLAVETKTI